MTKCLVCFLTAITLMLTLATCPASAYTSSKAPYGNNPVVTNDGLNFIVTENLSKSVTPTVDNTIAYLYKFLEQYNFPKLNNGFLPTAVDKDDLGFTHMKFHQTYCGKIVYGRSVSVHFNKDKQLYSISGSLENRIKSIEKKSERRITIKKAIALAKAYKNATELTADTNIQNYIYVKDNKAYDTYRVTIAFDSTEPVNSYIFVDTYSGKIIDEISNIKH